MAKSRKFSPFLTFIACVLALVIGFIAGFGIYTYLKRPKGGDVYVSGDLSFHFMQLGNEFTGDSIYIKSGDTDILIDAGSRSGSTETTSKYIDQYCTDGVLEYVIVTHSDRDHIAGFVGSEESLSIFARYECKTIIDFPMTNKKATTEKGNKTDYGKYLDNLQQELEDTEGAVHYTALQCWNEADGAKREYEISEGVTMRVLYNYFYEHKSSDENNYSVCLMFDQGDKHFLFTGDLEKEGEEHLVEYNDLPEVDLFKAGHHGSGTSSTSALLEKIKPDIVCVCCCAGTYEYADSKENTFPYQAMIDRVAEYTEQVYVTTAGILEGESTVGYEPLHGNIVVTSNRDGVSVKCSANDGVLLKDTDWFKENRTMPSFWE